MTLGLELRVATWLRRRAAGQVTSIALKLACQACVQLGVTRPEDLDSVTLRGEPSVESLPSAAKKMLVDLAAQGTELGDASRRHKEATATKPSSDVAAPSVPVAAACVASTPLVAASSRNELVAVVRLKESHKTRSQCSLVALGAKQGVEALNLALDKGFGVR